MRLDAVSACFVAYIIAYCPLIYLSTHSDLPDLAILPVSTFSCLLFAHLAVTVFGWWRHLRLPRAQPGASFWDHWKKTTEHSSARAAGWAAGPYTAAIMLLTPAAYALAGPEGALATLTVMKVGSLLVTLSKRVAGTRATPRVMVAVALCAMTLAVAAYGRAIWAWAQGYPWIGVAIGAGGLMAALAYMYCYSKRLQKMGPHKHSMAFYVAEHLAAPHLAMGALLLLAGAGWAAYAAGYTSQPLLDIAHGFTLWRRWDLWALGFASQVVGLAGGWILVGRSLSAAAMTLNRSAALLAGAALVALQGCHFQAEHASALVVPVVLALVGRSENRSPA